MRKVLIFLVVVMIYTFSSNVISDETVSYNSSYKGLKVRISTYQDMINIFGPPIKSTSVKYYYPGVHVTINNKTNTINTIIIFDLSFVDVNGVSVGDEKVSVERALYERINENEILEMHGNIVVDKHNGIIYWFKQNKVEKIVLAAKLLKNVRSN